MLPRWRAEAVSAQATAELLQLVPAEPPTESHQELVQVRRVLPTRVAPEGEARRT